MKDPKELTRVASRPVLGAQVQTKESFLYGKFETLMNPAYGAGIVSSFFLFDDAVGFQTNWHEIDFEYLGKNTNQIDTNVIRTVNGKKTNDELPITLGAKSSGTFWKLSINWQKDKITWSVNDQIIRNSAIALDKPMKIMMNLWAPDNGKWAGQLMDSILPQHAFYKYVKYSGPKGEWYDDFKSKDRWLSADWQLQQTLLRKEHALINPEVLLLKLTK